MRPKGTLYCKRQGRNTKWFVKIQADKKYLRKKGNKPLAEELAYKKYLSLLYEDLENERKAISHYLDYYNSHPPKATQLLSPKSPYYELLNGCFQPTSETLKNWMNEEYSHKQNYPEQLIHTTYSGHNVRSKSEALIDTALYQHKIPFRYEAPLTLDNIEFYPDFTIRHPRTGKYYYWEHFGLIDNPRYIIKTFNKLQAFVLNGIIPTINLITTYETKTNPLQISQIEALIATYFM